MARKYYNVMIFSGDSGNPRRFQFPKKAAGFLVSTFFIASVVFSAGTYYFYRQYFYVTSEVEELSSLRKENQFQQFQLHKFSKKIQELDSQMVRLEKFDRKLRVITALDVPKNQGKTKSGLGGSRINLDEGGLPDSPRHSLVNQIHDDLNDLRVRSELQEINFLELDEFFKNQSSLFSSTPSIWPTRGWVTSSFGYRRSPFTGLRELHEGIDIATRVGSPVVATANGVVVRAGRDSSFGKMVEIDHGYGVVTRYCHNSQYFVKAGDRVKRGQVISLVGNTGRSTGPHCHYEVLLNGVPVNPLRYILEEGTGNS